MKVPWSESQTKLRFSASRAQGSREGAGEASVAVRMGRAIEHRKTPSSGCRGFLSKPKAISQASFW